jgi:hypothetical protein
MAGEIIAARCQKLLKHRVFRRVFRQRDRQLMLTQASGFKSAILVIYYL